MIRHRKLMVLGVTAAALLVAAGLPAPVHGNPTAPVAIVLTDAIAPGEPTRPARGIFFERSVVVALPQGSFVLASTPDGRGELCSDDEARLTLANTEGEVVSWEHAFFSADRRRIDCIPPQGLGPLVEGGSYTVTLTLSDRYAPLFSSSAYYLVVPALEPLSDPTIAAPVPTVVAPTAPVAAVVPTARVASIQPTATARPAAVATAAVHASSSNTPAATIGRTSPWWIVLAGGVALVLLLVIARRPRRSGQARRSAVITLYDQSTREAHTAVLVGGQIRGVRRRPLALVAPEHSAVVARVQLTDQGVAVRSLEGEEQLLAPDTELHLAGGELAVRCLTGGSAVRPLRREAGRGVQ